MQLYSQSLAPYESNFRLRAETLAKGLYKLPFVRDCSSERSNHPSAYPAWLSELTGQKARYTLDITPHITSTSLASLESPVNPTRMFWGQPGALTGPGKP